MRMLIAALSFALLIPAAQASDDEGSTTTSTTERCALLNGDLICN